MLTKQVDERMITIPPDLRNYLTVTSKPEENYLALQHSRERRLRLLLRRFTNQIQYGCVNPYCDVPTCLSYRTRHSSVPVRPYSEVAARTLAWQCVEEYTGHDRPSTTNTHSASVNRRKSKEKTSVKEKTTNLCWNEPVIPWYEVPAEFIRKQRLGQDRQRNDGQIFSETGQLHAPSRKPLVSNRISKQNGKVIAESDQERETVHHHSQKTQLKKAECSPEMGDRALPHDAVHTDSSPIQSVAKPEINAPDPEHVAEQLKDTASFSQSLYDTLAIKDLDHFSSQKQHPSIFHNNGNESQEDARQIDLATNESTSDAAMQSDLSQASTYTFKILNKRVMSWLLTLVANKSAKRVLLGDLPTNSMSVTDLAQQTLHYCLSHPLRLLESVGQWGSGTISGSSTSDIISRGFDNLPALSSDSSKKKELSVTRTKSCISSLRDVNRAFEVLSYIQPHSMILRSIFMALQHSYNLPPHTHNTQSSCAPTASQDIHNQIIESSARRSANIGQEVSNNPDYLTDQQVASICLICILSIMHYKGRADQILEFPMDEETSVSTYFNYVCSNKTGQAFPNAYLYWTFNRDKDPEWKKKYASVLARIDTNEDLHLLMILESFGNIISHRLALFETLKTVKGPVSGLETRSSIIELLISQIYDLDQSGVSTTSQATLSLVDLMRVILLKEWDRKPVIRRASSVGGALQMLAGLYRHRIKLGMPENAFTIKFVAEAFDAVKMPLEWLSFRQNNKDMHILSYSFLFEPSYLVKYFRAMNIETMRRSHEYASVLHSMTSPWLSGSTRVPIPVYGTTEVLAELRPHVVKYFILTVRRDNMLEDAIDQIWRRQRQELMRPLKVTLGKDEGEGGLDHGGVQQEFFRLVLAAALNPDYGMFTIDESTRMTWFQPGSFEPLYKFEVIGILMSLAVYNAITLPVTFPLAFYRKLLGLKVKHLEHIEDGWPDLARGLKTLLDWADGDVGDVMARTYEFSYRLMDKDISIDMSRISRETTWPPSTRRKPKDRGKTATFEPFNLESIISPDGSSSGIPETSKLSKTTKREIRIQVHTPSITPNSDLVSPQSPNTAEEEAPLVTNTNRKQYVKDYIFWLTNKSITPQFEAFCKGFHTCLDTTALSIFTAEALKTVVEGHTEIDIEGLQATTVYEEFSATDQIIIDFWDIVKTSMSAEQHKHLLEFVTASDRVPVNGISTVTFIIQKNGDDDDRLPSSSTCYGRLLLPAYSSKEIMKEKLEKAIENSVGFGSL